MMKVTVVGLGLIGGSMAIALKDQGLATYVLGVDSDPAHISKALELGLVDQVVDLAEAVDQSELVILAIPINATEKLLPGILDKVDNQVVMDVGSTKNNIVEAVRFHKNRKQFVATHPMWGTEFSGPQAAIKHAFRGKACVICNAEESGKKALDLVKHVYELLGMHLLFMKAEAHDLHVAYVSHISHITSFALANTVLEKEKEDEAIFELASGGFESTVRLAKSNPAMWVPILMENRENVLDVLSEHISQLRKFKSCLEKENAGYLTELIENANKISNILK